MVKLKAFTLAEILSVLIILGVVASITIPTTLKRTTERANKTKIKKALSAYSTAVEKIVIENNLTRNQKALQDYINTDNCNNARKYFKSTELETANNFCRFKTADGLWWDIEDITNTLVSFKKEDLVWHIASGGEFKAFKFVTRFDSNNALRVNDYTFSLTANSYDIGIVYKEATKKIQAYLDDEYYLENILAKYSKSCFNETKNYRCTSSNKACRGCTSQWDRGDIFATGNYWGQYLSHVYDENGKEVAYMWHCEPGSNECSSVSTNGIYVEREDGLFIECYNCNNTFTAPAGDTFVQLQKREGDKVTCSCTGCEFAKYTNNGSKLKPQCKAAKTCSSCEGTGCPEISEDGCYRL